MLKRLKLNLWRPPRPSRTNTKNSVLFIIGVWNAKVGSWDTWSNSQIWPWSSKWNIARECTGHSKHPLPTTQDTTLHMDITRWSVPKSDRLHSLQPKMEKLYTVSKNKTRADCGWDHELIAKFRLKLKKVGKTTRPFRYDLSQIPYAYKMEVTYKFKVLLIDLVDRFPEEL